MKCISNKKRKAAVVLLIFALTSGLTGCGDKHLSSAELYEASDRYTLTASVNTGECAGLFADDLVKPETENSDLTNTPDIGTCKNALVIDTTDQKVLFSYNMLEKAYPASTTKILTAYLAFKYGKMDQEVTVSDDISSLDPSSSLCHVNPGDVLTLRQLVYGLMLPSGNDAALAIADTISGSPEKFAELMNKEAKFLGATKSHFVTANGLPDEDHYTTPYDMYLIFRAACQYDEFVQIIGSPSYNAYYRDSAGNPVQKVWQNSNRYTSGAKKAPDGFAITGGKTGTTGQAGYCLVLLCTAPDGHQLISIVYGADCNYNLYLDMNEILKASVSSG